MKFVLIGAGQRGADVYAAYALSFPNELKIVGVAEPADDRREALAARHGIGVAVLDDLQLILRLADEGSERYGDRQSDHSRARYAHTHGVFQNIGAESQVDALRLITQSFARFRHTQCHGYGLGASDGWHHLLMYQRDDGLSLCL